MITCRPVDGYLQPSHGKVVPPVPVDYRVISWVAHLYQGSRLMLKMKVGAGLNVAFKYQGISVLQSPTRRLKQDS